MSEQADTSSLPALSRALLTPGPLPPVSHFGLTLLRHVVDAGLRFSLYQLGLPHTDAPPVRIVGLRLFLDRVPLVELLADRPGGPAVLLALLDPGAGRTGPLEAKVRSAAFFHRNRLRLGLGRAPAAEAVSTTTARSEIWLAFKTTLAARLPVMQNAVLAEVLAVLDRQGRRGRGEEVGPADAPQAAKALRDADVRLACLGLPDPLEPGWSKEALATAVGGASTRGGPARSSTRRGRRGVFREAYRELLSDLRPVLEAYSESAVRSQMLREADDLYFMPFPLAEELVRDSRPGWVDGAVSTNRAEWEGLCSVPEHPDVMVGSAALESGSDLSQEWPLAPLLPLP